MLHLSLVGQCINQSCRHIRLETLASAKRVPSTFTSFLKTRGERESARETGELVCLLPSLERQESAKTGVDGGMLIWVLEV